MLYHRILIKGRVQGVGFRPCVFVLAKELGICGHVLNLGNAVEILLDSKKEEFLDALRRNLPKQAIIRAIEEGEREINPPYESFVILESKASQPSLEGILPQDIRICEACLKDMGLGNHSTISRDAPALPLSATPSAAAKPPARFHNYAFTTCIDCGPRYSILRALPYDRVNTSMRDFALCGECQKDYEDPTNRRFHAQPLSCNTCKIPLVFHLKKSTPQSQEQWEQGGEWQENWQSWQNDEALEACARSIKEGKIVAIKGVGGFALACSIENLKNIRAIREFKNRPYKPFAIMAKDIATARQYAHISPKEEEILLSKEAPIVLLKKRLPLQDIAPNLQNIGIILPYSGLHYLLFEHLESPIIFTSANLSKEPIITQLQELKERLLGLCDGVLDYEREIVNPIDDSLVQVVGGELQILRLARGYAPLHLCLPNLATQSTESQKVCIGMGAQEKITLAYRAGSEVVISPFIGELDNPATLVHYEKTYNLFLGLYALKPTHIISDKHPNYHSYNLSAKKSKQEGILWKQKQHHYAHFCAIFGDAMLQDSTLSPQDRVLGIIWDGTGMGEDGKIWGGEFLVGNLRDYERVGHFEEMEIYGGEGAIKEIYKIGYVFAKRFASPEVFEHFRARYFGDYPEVFGLFDTLVAKGIAPFITTSVGRLFDALASLLGVCDCNTYEAQAPMMLESLYNPQEKGHYPFEIKEGIVQIGGMFGAILEEIASGVQIGKIGYAKDAEHAMRECGEAGKHEAKIHAMRQSIVSKFINTLARIAYDFALTQDSRRVLFSGGVFINKPLCEEIMRIFSAHNATHPKNAIKIHFHRHLPSNDSNIALGQVLSL